MKVNQSPILYKNITAAKSEHRTYINNSSDTFCCSTPSSKTTEPSFKGLFDNLFTKKPKDKIISKEEVIKKFENAKIKDYSGSISIVKVKN